MQNNKSRYTFTAIRWMWIGSTSIQGCKQCYSHRVRESSRERVRERSGPPISSWSFLVEIGCFSLLLLLFILSFLFSLSSFYSMGNNVSKKQKQRGLKRKNQPLPPAVYPETNDQSTNTAHSVNSILNSRSVYSDNNNNNNNSSNLSRLNPEYPSSQIPVYDYEAEALEYKVCLLVVILCRNLAWWWHSDNYRIQTIAIRTGKQKDYSLFKLKTSSLRWDQSISSQSAAWTAKYSTALLRRSMITSGGCLK